MKVGHCKIKNRLLLEMAQGVDENKKRNQDGMMIKKEIIKPKHSNGDRQRMNS